MSIWSMLRQTIAALCSEDGGRNLMTIGASICGEQIAEEVLAWARESGDSVAAQAILGIDEAVDLTAVAGGVSALLVDRYLEQHPHHAAAIRAGAERAATVADIFNAPTRRRPWREPLALPEE